MRLPSIMDSETRLLLECSLQRRKGLFWSLSILPAGAAILATAIFSPLWFAYLLGPIISFGFLLMVVRGFELKVSESNWGRYERQKQPVGFWISQSMWIALWIIASGFPILIAIQKASK